MREGPPTYGGTPIRSNSLHGVNGSSSSSTLRSSSPLRAGGEYSSTSTLLQEISSLRGRLKELEDDGRSSIVSSVADGDNRESLQEHMLKKDVARLEQEKANFERELMNQLSKLQSDHQSRVNELHNKLRSSDERNEDIDTALRKVSKENEQLKNHISNSDGSDEKELGQKLFNAKEEIKDLHSQLKQARNASMAASNERNSDDKYMRMIEEQREAHRKETEKLMENLAAADLEIAEGREEIETLHQELEEMQTHREMLLDEITTVRLDSTEEQRAMKLLKSELTECKLSVEKLGHEGKEKDTRLDQKSAEISQLKQLNIRKQTEKENEGLKRNDELVKKYEKEVLNLKQEKDRLQQENEKLSDRTSNVKQRALNINTNSPESSPRECENAISPSEKNQLLKEMEALESRLANFHSKLADKDCTIENLSSSLSHERATTSKLKTEIEALKDSSCSNVSPYRNAAGISQSIHGTDKLSMSLTEKQSQRCETKFSRNFNSVTTRKKPSSKRDATPSQQSPRTPVSGLVASFERRTGFGLLASPSEQDETLISHSRSQHESPPSTAEDMKYSKSSVSKTEELQDQLVREKEIVADLRMQLKSEKKTVVALQEKLLSCPNLEGSNDLAKKLLQSNSETERLSAKLKELENFNAKRDAFLIKERAELNKLRSDAIYGNVLKEESDQRTCNDKREIEHLRYELANSKLSSSYNEEKKTDGEMEQVSRLKAQVVKKEKAIERLRAKHDEYEEASEEALDRLKNQVQALEHELEQAMTKIEELQESTNEAESARSMSLMQQRNYENERSTHELEVTRAKTRYTDLLEEYQNAVHLLEDKIQKLQEENGELLKEKTREARTNVESETQSLQKQLVNSQQRLVKLENEHSQANEVLVDRIKSLEHDLTSEKKNKKELEMSSALSSKSATTILQEKDSEIERLSDELSRAKLGKAKSDRDNLENLKKLEAELGTLENEADSELDAKQAAIDELNEALASKAEEVKRLEEEKNQLLAKSHNKEQTSEIQRLKTEIASFEKCDEESEVENHRHVTQLEDEIAELKQAMKSSEHLDTVARLESENEHLRDQIRDVKTERRQLKERLDSITQDKSMSRSSQVIRDRNLVLKEEVESLTKRLKKMEASITRFAI